MPSIDINAGGGENNTSQIEPRYPYQPPINQLSSMMQVRCRGSILTQTLSYTQGYLGESYGAPVAEWQGMMSAGTTAPYATGAHPAMAPTCFNY